MGYFSTVIGLTKFGDLIELIRFVFEYIELAILQAIIAILCSFQRIEQVIESSRDKSRICVGALHGVGLTRVGNAIAEYKQVVTFEEALEARVDSSFEEVLLVDGGLEDVGELEDCL